VILWLKEYTDVDVWNSSFVSNLIVGITYWWVGRCNTWLISELIVEVLIGECCNGGKVWLLLWHWKIC